MASMEQDTIVAISTPVGRGGIGVVRLSGTRALAAAAPLLRLRHPLAAGRARFGEIVDVATGDVLDQAVVTYFAAPNSPVPPASPYRFSLRQETALYLPGPMGL